jgi:GT2 family glycosyltransferase
MPPVYVVLLAHGGQAWLDKFLPPLLQTEYPACTIWVIDNGSSPPLTSWIQEKFPAVRVLRYEENLGYAGGYQRFFEDHGGEVPYLALLNSDVEVSPGWLSPLVELLEQYPRIAAVQPKILAYAQRQAFEYAGAAGGFLDAWGYPTCRGRGEYDTGQYNIPSRIFWASGAAFLLRTEAVQKDLGGLLFKSYYFMHMEEIDLCWRLQRAGWQIAYQPASQVYHVGGASLHTGSPQKTYYNFRNSLFLLWENLPSPERYWRIAWRLLCDAPAALYLSFKGGISQLGAVARAHWDFFKQARQLPRDSALPLIPYRALAGITPLPWFFGGRRYPSLPLE